MCGIAGVCNFEGRPVQRELIGKMIAPIGYRGPDDEGVFISQDSFPNLEAQAGLGHKRLSIIDLAGGHQPMSNEDGSIWLVHSGEIYNFPDLMKELADKGHRFKSHSDTEVIIHLYEEMGERCVHRLRGMFAFAVWDARKGRLFLTKDRLGKKPLNYYFDGKTLIFATEIKSILEYGIRRELDFASLDRYLTYGYTPHPDTIFKDVKKIPPAHFLIFDKNGIRLERFWQLKYGNKIKISEDELEERVTELIKDCIKVRLKSDVPLGVLLSGGIDSSTVVALLSEITSQSIKTFTIGFEDQDYSEIQFARQIAERFKTDHHEFIVKPETLKILPKLVWYYNEPFGDSSCIPTYYAAKITSEHVKVALSGDGGDESFAGYERYKGIRISPYFDWMPKGLLNLSGRLIGSLSGLSPNKRYKDYIRYAANFLIGAARYPDLADRYLSWVNFVRDDEKERLYTARMKELIKDVRPKRFLLEKLGESDAKDMVERIVSAEITTGLADDLLVKMEVASMANSLEARAPFLDYKLMEFMASVPIEYKLRGLTSKYILKKILSKRIPHNLLKRKKMGFGVPVGRWFRNEMREFVYDMLLDEKSLERGYFNGDYIKELLDEHVSGRADHKNAIWALLNFEIWHRIFIERQTLL